MPWGTAKSPLASVLQAIPYVAYDDDPRYGVLPQGRASRANAKLGSRKGSSVNLPIRHLAAAHGVAVLR